MLPWIELRGAIPVAMSPPPGYEWEWWQAYPLSVFGNMIPVPFILIFFGYIEKFLRRYDFWNGILDKLFDRTRKRASEKIKKYECLGLILFVAIPLPFTGAWTGSLISYLFGLKISKSIAMIFIGVLIAGIIVTIAVLSGLAIWSS
jgi:uncharacterized membrane protein